MARLRCTLASDGLTATVVVVPGVECKELELRNTMRAAPVRHGLDEPAIATLLASLRDPQWSGQCIIARGVPPEHGSDARLELAHTMVLQPGQKQADGHIDFRERAFLHPIEADAEIARIVPPTPGRGGIAVDGRALPAKPGQPLRVRFGKGVRLDGDRVVAARAGVVSWQRTALDVVDLYTHAGDVDYRTGNLHSEGSLELRGDVHEGFAVTASHDVLVRGAALDAVAEAGGNLGIEAVMGKRARAESGGDLHCHHATSATLRAGGTAVFGDGAAHCMVRADRIEAVTGRGALFGGELRATHAIVLRVGGTPNGAATVLAVADTSAAEADVLRRTLDARKLADQQRKLQRNAGDGKAARIGADRLAPEQEARIALARLRRELLTDACIEVHEVLHPGVTLRFGDYTFPIEWPRRHVRLRWQETTRNFVEEPLP